MIEIQIQHRKNNSERTLKLPMKGRSLKEVVPDTNDFFIKKVRSKYEIRLKTNDDLEKLNNAMEEFQSLEEKDKSKVLAINIKLPFEEAIIHKDKYKLIENIFSIEEYGRYVATEETNLSKRFLKYIDFKKYGEDIIRTCEECYFTKYGVLKVCE